jgi:chorismate mutase/prephenate dehydratase
MVNLPHEAGSLNKLLTRFSTLGLNLTKLESRPISNSPFEFSFYFDFEANLAKKEVQNLIAELENINDKFVFLGGYSEIL